jgi:hypothetical protein
MKRVIRLTESDLTRIVRRIINEESFGNDHQGMNSIYTQLKSIGFKKNTVGTNSVELGNDYNGLGVTFYSSDKSFNVWVYVKGNSKLSKKYTLSSKNNYDSSEIVKKVVTDLKNAKKTYNF